jgi:hypothetical protein
MDQTHRSAGARAARAFGQAQLFAIERLDPILFVNSKH